MTGQEAIAIVEAARAAGQCANLRGANLNDADLREANLRGAYLRGGDLSGAALSWANLYGANLYGADLRGTNLRGTGVVVVYIAPYTIVVVPGRVQVGCVDIEGAAEIDRLLGDHDDILALHAEAADVWPIAEPLVRAAVAHSRAERPDLWHPDVPEETA